MKDIDHLIDNHDLKHLTDIYLSHQIKYQLSYDYYMQQSQHLSVPTTSLVNLSQSIDATKQIASEIHKL